jgi:hypothetical protein
MISDLPYEDVVDRCGLAEIEHEDVGLSIPRFRRALKELTGGNWWCKKLCRSPLVSDIAVEPETPIWLTRNPSTGAGHAIVVEGEWIYDPALSGEWPRKHYPCADWNVLMLIGMAWPGSAAEVRASRRAARREASDRRWAKLVAQAEALRPPDQEAGPPQLRIRV